MYERKLDPLAILAARLKRFWPPLIGALEDLLEGVEWAQAFWELVEEYLPERATEIRRATLPSEKIAIFASHFSDRYFPLEEWLLDGVQGEMTYTELVLNIPIVSMGWEDEWHEPQNLRDGDALIIALFEGEYWDAGMRTVWQEHCAGIVGQEQIQRIPDAGWDIWEMRRLLSGTWFEGVAHTGDWIAHDTGTIFLDVTYEMPFRDDWNPQTVELLTGLWLQASLKMDQMTELVRWLEEDPTPRFTEMLDFIFEREKLMTGEPNASPKTLMEVFNEEVSS